MQTFEEFIENSDLIKLAKIEAAHRYYYDVAVKSGDQEVMSKFGYIVGENWCLYPDWRYQLVKYMDRYKFDLAPITWIPICSRPNKRTPQKPIKETEMAIDFTSGIPAYIINTIDFRDYSVD